MIKKSYKVALMYLEAQSYQEKKNVLFNMIEEIRNGKIKNKKDFISLAKVNEINDRDIINIIQTEIDKGGNIKDFLIFLGEGDDGIKYIPNTWFARNIDDTAIKRIPSKYWNLIRNKQWIEQKI